MTVTETGNIGTNPAIAGFSLVEVLIALGIMSIGMAAITAAMISATANSRNTARSDLSIMWGQEVMEQMVGAPGNAPGMSIGARSMRTDNGRIDVEVFDPVDVNNDGRDNYITISTRVFVENAGTEELRMENIFRRPLN